MRSLLGLLALLCTASSVGAQEATNEERANAAAASERSAADPTLRSTARSTTPAIVVQFTSQDKTAQAQIGGGMGSSRRWALTVSGPLEKSGERTTLATGEGLNSGFNAEFLLRNTTLSRNPPIDRFTFRDLCLQHARPDRRDAVVAARGSCQRDDLTDEGKRIVDARGFRGVWTFGGSVKVGRADFSYTHPATFVDASETHEGWSASAAIGRFQSGPLAALLYYVGLSYRYEDAWKGNRARNICTPIGTSTSSYCREIASGAPTQRTSNLFQAEARSFIGEHVGLAPRVTYESGEEEWFVDVPIYLRQGAGPFNGGVSIGWDSESEEVVFSLFVGAIPKILP